MKTRGKFIVIEGIDGAGTTTQTELLAMELRRIANIRSWWTAEPTIGVVGDEARELAGRGYSDPILNARTALLFAADRLEHAQEIELELAVGNWVICDRYLPSSIVYQGHPGSVRDWVVEINRYAKQPDATILLDVPPEVALARIQLRGGGDANETLPRLGEHANRYNEFRWDDIEHFKIDGAREESTVHVDIVFALKRLIDEYHAERGDDR